MAYFANSSEGSGFDSQCAECRYGRLPCPIFWVQTQYNYKACNNDIATAILDDLVKQDGTCAMYAMDEERFYRDPSDLFDE